MSHWCIIQNMNYMMFIHQIIFKILSKITGPWNTCILWGQSLCYTDPISQVSHISNRLQDIRQNHWTMKYRSLWPIFILRSKGASHWLIIQMFDINPSNSLQDIRQNHSTVKYRLQLPVPGRPATFAYSRTRACCACSRCGTGGLYFSSIFPF